MKNTMARTKVIVCCWEKSHETELLISRSEEEAIQRKILKNKVVCPTCKVDNINNPIFVKEGATLFNAMKHYQCKDGHASLIGLFNHGWLHIQYGPGPEDFFNIKGSLEELPELIDTDEIICHHKECGLSLKAVDNYSLQYSNPPGIKTKQRIGDIWDKAGIEPVRSGQYDKDGNYQATHTEKANKHRIRKLQKERNVSLDRIPGEVYTKPTERKAPRRNRNQVDS
jgi:hypothetical protein